MDRKTFFQKLHQYDPEFAKFGYKRATQNTFLSSNNIKLSIVLDKWGWNSEIGGGFDIRLTDMNKTVGGLGNVHPRDQLDLNPIYFVEKDKIDRAQIEEVYKTTPKELLEEFNQGWWYKYYDEEHLKKVLKTFLPIILTEAQKFRSTEE